MKTKPASANNSGSMNSGSSKSRKTSHNRDREKDKKRSVPSGESGASSQCDTPPLTEKDNLSHGKFAGISPESIQCMAEQVLSEQPSSEILTNLAEDVSYKLRQLIHNIALYAQHNKIQRVDVDNVNSVLKLMDTEPVLGAPQAQWGPVGDAENLCTNVDNVVDVMTVATQQQNFLTVTPPTLSTVWLTDNKTLNGNTYISPTLQNYYTRASKALLSNNKRLIRVALNDLSSNTHIGPIISNFMNLSILVLSEESIRVLAPTTHQTLQIQALNMLETLLLNPCCSDTDVTLQLQRLLPFLVSSILTESVLSDQMLRIMASITNTWPQFAHIGRSIVLDYLNQGVQERLSPQLVNCLTSLGRQALVDGLLPHLSMIEAMMDPNDLKVFTPGMYEALQNASHIFLMPLFNKYNTEMVHIDEMLYELLGDSLIPRRIYCLCPEKIEEPPPVVVKADPEEEIAFEIPKVTKKKVKFHIVKYFPVKKENSHYLSNVFDTTGFCYQRREIIMTGPRVKQLRILRHQPKVNFENEYRNGNRHNSDRKMQVIIADGHLARFKYKLPDEIKLGPKLRDYTL